MFLDTLWWNRKLNVLKPYFVKGIWIISGYFNLNKLASISHIIFYIFLIAVFLFYFSAKLIDCLYDPFIRNIEKELGHVNYILLWIIYKLLCAI